MLQFSIACPHGGETKIEWLKLVKQRLRYPDSEPLVWVKQQLPGVSLPQFVTKLSV